MEYAQLNEDGSYNHQITTHGDVVWDATHQCPASKLTPEEATLFRVVPLIKTDPPSHDPITQRVQRDGGEFVNEQWQYKWAVISLDAATVTANQAAAAEHVRLAAIDTAIAGDNTISTLKAMSAQQFDDWWTANVTNQAQASNVLKRLARIVLRRVL